MAIQFRKVISANSASRVDQANRRAKGRFGPSDVSADNFNFNILNDIYYKGRQDRQTRYDIYNQMDMDTDIFRALDIIAEHCTQKDKKSKTPFIINVNNAEIGQEDADTLFEMMRIWNSLNEWDNGAFRAIRNTIKYGDTFFIRDNNYKLYPLAPVNVEGAYADEETGEVQAYKVVGLKRKFDCMFQVHQEAINNTPAATYQRGGGTSNPASQYKTYTGIISVENMIHLSLNAGIDVGGNAQGDGVWPFGVSFLENIFKDYKARSLLEDAEIIHRLQRAPARRVFYVDTGKMRPDKQETYMRKFKNEIQQKRIPSSFGGQNNLDTIYNPISQMDDLYLPTNSEGKGSRVENLEGQAWSNPEILQYFNSKLLRGLRVPTSFMLGPEEGGAAYNDGRTGTAYMQEFQFSQSCERVQNLVCNNIDFEFKMFLKYRGVDIHNGYFNLKFTPPMNFEEYRQRALDDDRLQTLSSALSQSYISKRFALKKFGNFTEDEILENEHMWMEENMSAAARQHNQDNSVGGMGVGMGSFNNSFGGSGMGEPEMGEFGAEPGVGGPQGGAPAPQGGMPAGGAAGGVGAGGAPGVESVMKSKEKNAD